MLSPIVKKLLPKHTAREALAVLANTPATPNTTPRPISKPPAAPIFPTFPSSSTIFSIASFGSEASLLYPEVLWTLSDISKWQHEASPSRRPGTRRAFTTPNLHNERTEMLLHTTRSMANRENLRPVFSRHPTSDSGMLLHKPSPIRSLDKTEVAKHLRSSPAHRVEVVEVPDANITLTDAPHWFPDAGLPQPASKPNQSPRPGVGPRPKSALRLHGTPVPNSNRVRFAPAPPLATNTGRPLIASLSSGDCDRPTEAPRHPAKRSNRPPTPPPAPYTPRAVGTLSRSGAVYRGRRGRSVTPTTLDWAATTMSPSAVCEQSVKASPTPRLPASGPGSWLTGSGEVYPQTLVTAVSLSFLSLNQEPYSALDTSFERSIANAMANVGSWAGM